MTNTDCPFEGLQNSLKEKRASLTPGEAAFLSALLIDDSTKEEDVRNATKKLNDEILFSIPTVAATIEKRPECTRPNRNQLELWKAFEDGVKPKLLRQKSKLTDEDQPQSKKKVNRNENLPQQNSILSDDGDSVRSDVEVRHENKDEASETSSWNESDGAPDNYDTWEVLKDEYAKDFGFDYSSERGITPEELETEGNVFTILGTSAADISACPHVLSPPLMDSLMTFLPESVQNQNYWLKYSLVRDGSGFDTLKKYVRGAEKSILAVETTEGNVFGAFVSSTWRNSSRFYGTGEAFLWKMRHNRNTICSSLFDQAQMESEIDVYIYTGQNDMIQLCTQNRIAVGGGDIEEENVDGRDTAEGYGFGLAIDWDLLNGSSSPCATFRNPCLSSHGFEGKTFQIVNLEMWTLTPCLTVDAAEKLEMTKFFVSESNRVRSHGDSSTEDHFGSNELLQGDFYRRVGVNDRNEEVRDRWQYSAMVNGTVTKTGF
mmetsp:Transcript_27730/g.39170  ORF Transcript_27730/g.39170 Transcript_27730/m.39170 type:complete len:488 (+) Transcript_27730:43-1506(+)|eukprot:CAMPEP_0202452310 /NCGR_PEP_ID=MMETSP1360-20130828/10548_1 /ASSEMBLY_ACC=CAM_ASM_000848 /TAXON_ID=515479 /ORGANISM="Licmophora paradoxa, Strain CCMP2313" /LENGTH=487 /DNA_ID=CAMNT_0049071097 /DNA_START=38 /DNA_END=1501 /DNA_ORIENTATION=+